MYDWTVDNMVAAFKCIYHHSQSFEKGMVHRNLVAVNEVWLTCKICGTKYRVKWCDKRPEKYIIAERLPPVVRRRRQVEKGLFD
jgi:hypothetical protein